MALSPSFPPPEEIFYSPVEILPDSPEESFFSPQELLIPTEENIQTPVSISPPPTESVREETSIQKLREEARRVVDQEPGSIRKYQVRTQSLLTSEQEELFRVVLGPFIFRERVLSVTEGTPRNIREGVVLLWYSLVPGENGTWLWTLVLKYREGVREIVTLPPSIPIFQYGATSGTQETIAPLLGALLIRDYQYPVTGVTRIPRNQEIILEPLMKIPPRPYDVVPLPPPSETYLLALQTEPEPSGFRLEPIVGGPTNLDLSPVQGLDLLMSPNIVAELDLEIVADPLVWGALGEYTRFPILQEELQVWEGFPMLLPMAPSLQTPQVGPVVSSRYSSLGLEERRNIINDLEGRIVYLREQGAQWIRLNPEDAGDEEVVLEVAAEYGYHPTPLPKVIRGWGVCVVPSISFLGDPSFTPVDLVEILRAVLKGEIPLITVPSPVLRWTDENIAYVMYCLYRAVADRALGFDGSPELLQSLTKCRVSSNGLVSFPAYSQEDIQNILGNLERRLRNGLRITYRVLDMEEGIALRYLASREAPQTLWLVVPIGESNFFLVGDQEFVPWEEIPKDLGPLLREIRGKISESSIDSEVPLPVLLNKKYGIGAWNGLITTPMGSGLVTGRLEESEDPVELPGEVQEISSGDTSIFSVRLPDGSSLPLAELPKGTSLKTVQENWRTGVYLTPWARRKWRKEEMVSALTLVQPL